MATCVGRWGGVLVGLLLAQAACATSRADVARSVAEAAVGSAPAGTTLERQLRRSATLSLGVRGLEQARQRCAELVQQSGGYLENTSTSEDAVSLVARVPAENLDRTLDAMAQLGRVRARSVSAEDVTEQVMDLDSRLKNQSLLRDRLRALLEKGGDVKDLLAVEIELARVQSEIESAQSRLDYLKRQVALSTLTVYLGQETVQLPGPGGLAIEGISRLLEWFFRMP